MNADCETRVRRVFPPLRPESGHLLHLDALRLIAAAGIVVLHVATFLDAGTVSDRLVTATRSFGLFVDMFFVVSGFVIAFVYFDKVTDARSYRFFLRKRLARLAPLHWLTLAIFAAIGLTAHFLHIQMNHSELFNPQCFPSSLLFLNSMGFCPYLSFNAVSWSISAEMAMYLGVPLLFWSMRRYPFGAAFVAASAALALSVVPGTPWYTWTAAGGFLRALPSFAFGAMLFSARSGLSRLPLAPWGFWLGVFAFVAGCSLGMAKPVLLAMLYGTVACGVAADGQARPSRAVIGLACAGQLTYSSYLLHPLVMIVILNILTDRILHVHGWGRTLLVVLTFLAVWPVSYLSLIFFERPLRRWLSGAAKEAPLPGAVLAGR